MRVSFASDNGASRTQVVARQRNFTCTPSQDRPRHPQRYPRQTRCRRSLGSKREPRIRRKRPCPTFCSSEGPEEKMMMVSASLNQGLRFTVYGLQVGRGGGAASSRMQNKLRRDAMMSSSEFVCKLGKHRMSAFVSKNNNRCTLPARCRLQRRRSLCLASGGRVSGRVGMQTGLRMRSPCHDLK